VSVAVPVCGWVVYTVYCVFLLLSVLFAAGGRSLFVQSEWHWTNDSAVVLGTFWGTYSFYLTLLHLAIVRLFHGFVHQIHLCQFVVGNFRNNCFQLDVLFMDEWVDSMLSTHWLDSFCAACSMPDHINWHVQLWDYPSLFHLFLDFIFVSLFAISTVVKTDQIWHLLSKMFWGFRNSPCQDHESVSCAAVPMWLFYIRLAADAFCNPTEFPTHLCSVYSTVGSTPRKPSLGLFHCFLLLMCICWRCKLGWMLWPGSGEFWVGVLQGEPPSCRCDVPGLQLVVELVS